MSGPYDQQPNWTPQPGQTGQPGQGTGYGQSAGYGQSQQPGPYNPLPGSPQGTPSGGTVYGSPQGGYGAPQQGGYGAPQPASYGTPQPASAPQAGSYGAPQPASYGTPQPASYGTPQPGGYGQPAGPPGYPPYPPAPASGKNAYAIVSLIFGIIGGIPLGIGFGIAGLVRAGKVQRGKAMSVIGIVLSVLWLAPTIYLIPHLVKASDPGCVAAKAAVSTLGNSKLNADANDPAALQNDLKTLVSDLNAAADKSTNAASSAAISKLAADFNELLTDVTKGTPAAPDLQSRIDADANAVDSACGTIGS